MKTKNSKTSSTAETLSRRGNGISALRLCVSAVILSAVLLCLAAPATAAPVILVGNLVTVDTTTSNSAPISLTSPTYIAPFSITHGALATTNNLPTKIQLSLDGTNYITLRTVYPTTTNASATDSYVAQTTNLTVYLRASITTTNLVTVGGSYGN